MCNKFKHSHSSRTRIFKPLLKNFHRKDPIELFLDVSSGPPCGWIVYYFVYSYHKSYVYKCVALTVIFLIYHSIIIY